MRPAVPPPQASDERQATGRERHDHKITVYLSAAELLDLEHARLRLRRFGFVIDRGRLVREAIAILLADLDARGTNSVVARRIRSRDDKDEDEDEDAVPSLSGHVRYSRFAIGHAPEGPEGRPPRKTTAWATWRVAP